MEYENKMAKLTPYELVRKPQPMPDPEKTIKVTRRYLESELSCAICLGLLKNTRTTKECLHRFCNECISQALRSGNKECPNCRKKLASMRSLRPDPIFDQIINVIFPNREEMELQERRLLEKLNSSSNRKALVNSIEEGRRHQAERRGVRRGKSQSSSRRRDEDSEAGPSVSASASEAGSVLGGTTRGQSDDRTRVSEITDVSICSETSDASKLFLQIIPHPDKSGGLMKNYAKKWKRRLIKVRSCATIGHVSHFIAYRLTIENSRGGEISLPTNLDLSKIRIDMRTKSGGFQGPLEPDLTLEQVSQLHSRSSSLPMVLAFTVSGKLKSK